MTHAEDTADGAIRAPARPPMLGLLGVAAGLSAANLYYAQPLAAVMAKSFGVREGTLGIALMLCQLGYALGMLVLVPLGDGRERRGLMVATASAATVMLLLLAAAPTFPALAIASFAVGFASSLPQMLIPYATGIVAPAERGRAIGVVMSGLLAGILLSRTVSGTLASVIGWRATFVCAAAVMAVVAVGLRTLLAPQRPETPLSWPRIVASLADVFRDEPVLRRHAFIGAMGFAAFSVFWSTLAFVLASRGMRPSAAGLFGALGVAGVIVAPVIGRVATRIPARTLNAVGLLSVAAAFGLMHLAGGSLVLLGVAVVVLDAGVQTSHLSNQTAIFGLQPTLRSRINAVYMVSYFLGGALGTAVGAACWTHARWPGVCLAGAVFALMGLAPWLRRSNPVTSTA